MIEIKTKLVRAESSTYAVGEKVECLIEFKNVSAESTDCSDLDNLAWASVQLHCYRKTNYSVNPQKKNVDLAELIRKTALDNAVTKTAGDVILSTKPKILFCDLKLHPKESKIYFFSEFIPRDGPPTYRGHDIKYFYRLTIATQRVKSKVQTLAIPIRVLPIPIIGRTDEMPCTEETNDELAPTNPFIEKREVSELEISWHHLKNVTARRAPKFYRISNKNGFVGRFCLFKPCYKLGEDIVGSLDFTDCKVRCVQFSVKLQSQEICLHVVNSMTNDDSSDINDASSVKSVDMASVASGTVADNLHKSSTSGTKHKSGGASSNDEEPAGKITTHATNHQVSYAVLQTHIHIPIPLHVTPSFRTDLVDVRWRLHFEFVTSTMMDFGANVPSVGELKAPSEIPIETMVWNLPITVYTANPLQIHSPSQVYNIIIK